MCHTFISCKRASMRHATLLSCSMHLAGASGPRAGEGSALHEAKSRSDLDVRRRDEVDVVAAMPEVELDPPQHARIDRIGEDHLNGSASCAASTRRARTCALWPCASVQIRTCRRLASHQPDARACGWARTHALYEVLRGVLVVRRRDEPARAVLLPRREERARRSVVAEPRACAEAGACAHTACRCALLRFRRPMGGREYTSDGLSSEDDVGFGRVVARPALRPVGPRQPAAGQVALDDVAVDRARKRRHLRGTRDQTI